MSKKFAVVMMVLVAMLSTVLVNGFAFAGDDEEEPVQIETDDGGLIPIFADGRLNGLDMTETVAVYYDYSVTKFWNGDDELEAIQEVSAIQVWVVEAYTGEGQLALYVPIADVQAAMSAGVDTTIASGNGASLGYSAASGLLWVSGPNGYVFTWEL